MLAAVAVVEVMELVAATIGVTVAEGTGRGRGGRFANFQCQICLKYGHTANICFYRADSIQQQSFQHLGQSQFAELNQC
ncbi:Zinc finger, CCHC-type superfamily [Sesbania bispinosa]|nr:Zinc finger, CCHC-type superfamily [Sesbania bispinosa]